MLSFPRLAEPDALVRLILKARLAITSLPRSGHVTPKSMPSWLWVKPTTGSPGKV